MCGIFGEFFINRELTGEGVFRELNSLNTLRGPDSDGYWRAGIGQCQLGFRRLSILDLTENGNQPMVSPGGDWVMVFNGEIYNYREIRDSLPAGKYNFRGHSDSEVILAAFEHFGVMHTARMLDGMFAIGLYNISGGKLYLIRDFAGIKPLFYAELNGNIIFGSQYDQLSHHPLLMKSGIKQDVLRLYLQLHYMPAPMGILEQTKQLAPGEIISFDKNGRKEVSTFWQFPEPSKNLITSEKEALDLIDEQLELAVAAEMIADVPVGTFLSGGIDSPLVTYYAHKHLQQIKSFSIGSNSKVHDESEAAARYASLIGCSFNLDMMEAKSAGVILEKVMQGLKEPFADFSAIPTYLVSKHARRQVTVSLSGDGGDELFFGYERFWSMLKNTPYNFVPRPLRYMVYGIDRALFKNRHVNSAFLQPGFAAAHMSMHCRFSNEQVSSLFPDLAETRFPAEFKLYDYTASGDRSLLHEMQKAEFYGMMQKTLTKVDRMSMANSLEVRVPFLKKTFIENSLKVDAYLSFGANKKKELLKKLLRRKLGDITIDNTKKGFSIPLTRWLREDIKQPVAEAIFDPSFLADFNINGSALETMWKEHMDGRDHKWPIFTIFSLAKWKQSLK
jgi:asparagine synthase (glutamine-hydrolysing)